MRKLLLLINFTFFTLHFTFFTPKKSLGQTPLVKQWDKTFGGFENEWLFGFQQTTDGGFILAGYTNSDSTGNITQPNWDPILATDDYWMIKTDASGNKLWDKRFGGTSYDYLLDIQQTSDGGYILGGESHSGANGDKSDPSHDTTSLQWLGGDYWIVKTDSLGNKQWDKTFGGCDADQLRSVQQTPDGGYILGGTTNSDSCGDVSQHSKGFEDFWLVKTDSLGNMQWNKRYGGNNTDVLNSLRVTPDGGYILAGQTQSDSTGDVSEPTRGAIDYWFLKTDAAGTKQWDKRFGGTGNEFGNWVQCTHDGGYIMSGISNSGIGGDKTEGCYGIYDGWVVKIDAVGNKQWDRTFGGTGHEPGYSYIMQTSDNGYLFSITSESDSSGNKTEDNIQGYAQSWVVKTDSMGTIEWDKTLFIYGDCASGMSCQATDGCYLFANFNNGTIGGYKTEPNWDPNGSSFDFWMVKFCDSTSTTSIAQLPDYPITFSIYPNPANEYVTINYHFKAGDEIRLTDVLGKTLITTTITTPTSDFRLLTSNLSPGIYLLKAGNEVRKFIKE